MPLLAPTLAGADTWHAYLDEVTQVRQDMGACANMEPKFGRRQTILRLPSEKILDRGLNTGNHTYTLSPRIDPPSRGLITIHLFGWTPRASHLGKLGKDELNSILADSVGPMIGLELIYSSETAPTGRYYARYCTILSQDGDGKGVTMRLRPGLSGEDGMGSEE